jgi:hypothetical protein
LLCHWLKHKTARYQVLTLSLKLQALWDVMLRQMVNTNTPEEHSAFICGVTQSTK